jgi:hypothetical protein
MLIKHAIRIHGDELEVFSKVRQLCRKHHAGFHKLRGGLYILPKPVLEELAGVGLIYDCVELTSEESKQVALHATISSG